MELVRYPENENEMDHTIFNDGILVYYKSRFGISWVATYIRLKGDQFRVIRATINTLADILNPIAIRLTVGTNVYIYNLNGEELALEIANII